MQYLPSHFDNHTIIDCKWGRELEPVPIKYADEVTFYLPTSWIVFIFCHLMINIKRNNNYKNTLGSS